MLGQYSSSQSKTKNVRLRVNAAQMKTLFPQVINLIHNDLTSTATPGTEKVLYFSRLSSTNATYEPFALTPDLLTNEGNDPNPEYRLISSVYINQVWATSLPPLYQYYPYPFIDASKLPYLTEHSVYANTSRGTSQMPYPRKRGIFYHLYSASNHQLIRLRYVGVKDNKYCTGVAFYANTSAVYQAWLNGHPSDDYKAKEGSGILLDDFSNQWFVNNNYNAISTNGYIALTNSSPNTQCLEFTLNIPFDKYTIPVSTNISTPVPDPNPSSIEAEPEYLEQRKALQDGINLKVVDSFHRDTLGNGEIRGRENIINNSVKDEDTAFKVGQIAIQKSRRNLEVKVLAPPMFQLEPGKFLSMPISAKNMSIFEPIENLHYEISADRSDYELTVRGVGKDNV